MVVMVVRRREHRGKRPRDVEQKRMGGRERESERKAKNLGGYFSLLLAVRWLLVCVWTRHVCITEDEHIWVPGATCLGPWGSEGGAEGKDDGNFKFHWSGVGMGEEGDTGHFVLCHCLPGSGQSPFPSKGQVGRLKELVQTGWNFSGLKWLLDFNFKRLGCLEVSLPTKMNLLSTLSGKTKTLQWKFSLLSCERILILLLPCKL